MQRTSVEVFSQSSHILGAAARYIGTKVVTAITCGPIVAIRGLLRISPLHRQKNVGEWGWGVGADFYWILTLSYGQGGVVHQHSCLEVA